MPICQYLQRAELVVALILRQIEAECVACPRGFNGIGHRGIDIVASEICFAAGLLRDLLHGENATGAFVAKEAAQFIGIDGIHRYVRFVERGDRFFPGELPHVSHELWRKALRDPEDAFATGNSRQFLREGMQREARVFGILLHHVFLFATQRGGKVSSSIGPVRILVQSPVTASAARCAGLPRQFRPSSLADHAGCCISRRVFRQIPEKKGMVGCVVLNQHEADFSGDDEEGDLFIRLYLFHEAGDALTRPDGVFEPGVCFVEKDYGGVAGKVGRAWIAVGENVRGERILQRRRWCGRGGFGAVCAGIEGEDVDGARLAIIDDREVFFVEIGDGLTVRIGDQDFDLDDAGFGVDCRIVRLRLGEGNGYGEERD